MKSETTSRFRKALAKLPSSVRSQALTAYRRFANNPRHPGLRFKQVHPEPPVWSVRINRNYRALGVKHGETIVWFWIGNHEDYDELLKSL